jgi:hypothetical protein
VLASAFTRAHYDAGLAGGVGQRSRSHRPHSL